MSNNKIGRPTVLNKDTVSKLEEAFKLGASVSEACLISGISRDTFYRHFNADSTFSDKMERARSWILVLAKRNIANAIGMGNTKLSVWLLEKHESLILRSIAEEMPDDEMSEENMQKRAEELEQYVQARIRIDRHRSSYTTEPEVAKNEDD